jgi:hypothetical protein
MGRKPTAVTVTRRYRADETSCEDAIRRLLDYGKPDHARNRDRRPDADGPCDAKGSSDEVRARLIIPKRT